MGGDRSRPHEPGGRGADALDGLLEAGAADVAAADRDPLVDPHEVGRGVPPHGEARGAERGVGVGHDRSLAVGARHQEGGERALGMAQGRGERAHRLEAELDPEAGATRQVRGGAGAAGGSAARHRDGETEILQ